MAPPAAVIAGSVIAGAATAYAVHMAVVRPIQEEGWDSFCANAGHRWGRFLDAWGKRAHDLNMKMQGKDEGKEHHHHHHHHHEGGGEDVPMQDAHEFEGAREEEEEMKKRYEEEMRERHAESTAIENVAKDGQDDGAHDGLRRRHAHDNDKGDEDADVHASTPTMRNPFDDLDSSQPTTTTPANPLEELDSPHHDIGSVDEEEPPRSETLSPPQTPSTQAQSGSDGERLTHASGPTSPNSGSSDDAVMSTTSWSDVDPLSGTASSEGGGGSEGAEGSEEWEQLSDEESPDEEERR